MMISLDQARGDGGEEKLNRLGWVWEEERQIKNKNKKQIKHRAGW